MSIEQLLADMAWKWLDQRFRILATRVEPEKLAGIPVPYMVSEEFVARFETAVRDYVLPEMISRCRGILRRVEDQPEDQRRKYLEDLFDDRKGRQVMWETWRESWMATMMEIALPPKPEPKAKGLGSFLKKDKKKPGAKKELTEEEWKAAVQKIKGHNATIDSIWGGLQDEASAFVAPDAEDRTLLMELFGRNERNLAEQIKAVHQIVSQGGNTGMAFDRYQRGKNVDLALLAASYQLPELLLGGGELKNLLRGHKSSDFPLVFRFLSEFAK